MKTESNPALGAHLQPFAGIPTFMRRPATRELAGVDLAVVGVPFDSGTSYRSGSRFGPRKIREASLLLWGHNAVLGVSPLERLNVVDYGDVQVVPVDVEATLRAIDSEVGNLLAAGATVLTLGGDHSIALPLLRAHARKHGPLAVVQFDSHPDTWNREYPDHPYSHGTPFRRAIEEGLIDTAAYLQVGIRGPVGEAGDLAEAQSLGAQVITIGRALEMGTPWVLQTVRAAVGERPTYVSLDIDAADPAFAPGTGTPEVGGFTSYQLLQLVRGLLGLRLVGFDIVEVNPAFDHGDITAILAANLAFEFLSLLALATPPPGAPA
jgi:agmatinase/guanidinopropionase